VRQLLRRDPVQPRAARLADVAEAPAALVRNRERLGEQVGGHLGVEHAAVEVREQLVGPAVVELAKGARVTSRGDYQLGVGHS
jgi:hypothetical protein